MNTVTQVRTERGQYVFKVKEGSDGCWICAEPLREDMPVLKSALLGLDLFRQTDVQQATKIADFLNQHIDGIHLTFFDDHPLFSYKL